MPEIRIEQTDDDPDIHGDGGVNEKFEAVVQALSELRESVEVGELVGKAMQAYFFGCDDEIRAGVREMAAILNNPDSDDDERAMAAATICDALLPDKSDEAMLQESLDDVREGRLIDHDDVLEELG